MNATNKNSLAKHPLFAWQDTRVGLAFIVLFDLVVAYVFASLAINSGSLIEYFLTIVFLVLAVGQFVKLVKKVFHRG